MVEPVDPTPTSTYHKVFMNAKPPNFCCKEGPDRARAEEWLREIEKAFSIVKVPERLKVTFGTYMLVEDAEAWWSTLFEIKYRGEEPTWEQLTEQFKQAYVSRVVREKRVREFLELN